MSVEEIIEQIKRLDPKDRQTVREFPGRRDPIPKAEMTAMIHRVFDEHDELFRKLAEAEKLERLA